MESINNQLIIEIITASKILIAKTKQEDHLVFIGQSPDYLSYLVSKSRKISRIPMSGRLYSDKYTIPTKTQLACFFKTLDNFKLNYENIILIDHSHSGQSISGFAKLLNIYFRFISDDTECTNNFYIKSFKFINLISTEQLNGWICCPDFTFVKTIGYIVMPSLVNLANSVYPRTIIHYAYFEWDILGPELINNSEYQDNYLALGEKIDKLINETPNQIDLSVKYKNYINLMRHTIFEKNIEIDL
jgi:hypothetical protein